MELWHQRTEPHIAYRYEEWKYLAVVEPPHAYLAQVYSLRVRLLGLFSNGPAPCLYIRPSIGVVSLVGGRERPLPSVGTTNDLSRGADGGGTPCRGAVPSFAVFPPGRRKESRLGTLGSGLG